VISPAPSSAHQPAAPARSRVVSRLAVAVIAAVFAVVLAPGAAFAQTSYTIAPGDTLGAIAAAHGVAVDDIVAANEAISDPNLIIAGDTITIPGGQSAAPAPAEEPAPAPASEPEPEPAAEPEPAPAVAEGSVWDALAACESGGNWSINTGNGYYGGLQFSESSWRAVGGTGLPHEHSRETQIEMGKRLQAAQGWGAWPSCAAQLGLG